MTTKKNPEPIMQTVDIEEFKRQRKLVEQQANAIVDANMKEIKRLMDEINSWVGIAGLDFNLKEEIADHFADHFADLFADHFGQSWKSSSDYC